MSDAPETPAEAAAPAPPSALKRALPKLAVFGVLALAAFAAALFVLRPFLMPHTAGGNVAAQAAPAKPEKFGRTVSLDAVIVNVAQTEGRRFLKATVQMEVPDEEKLVKEVEARRPQILDLVIGTLARKTLAEVTSPDALDRVRTELQERIVKEMSAEKVRRVFITEFVVQ
jgi:flagellar basal body-associated protein FliL